MVIVEISDKGIVISSKDDDYKAAFSIPNGWKPDVDIHINEGVAYLNAKQINGNRLVLFTMIPYNTNNMPIIVWKDTSKKFAEV